MKVFVILLALSVAAPSFQQVSISSTNELTALLGAALQDVTNINIPTIAGTSGKVTYSVSNIRLFNVQLPRITNQDVGSNAVRLSVMGLGISVDADWSVILQTKGFPLSADGGLSANVTDVDARVTVTVVEEPGVGTRISLSNCDITVGTVEFDFRGGLSFLLRLFEPTVERKVRELIPENVCKKIKDFVIKRK
jgi:hypothetical protein